ncbi:MAG: hypothetical protein HOQ22_02005 [Nocardioidaceae bacterium]|nr:hypothetical protein [Nocardioidaceae bacterium]NUS49799.1 hypothetical protein [Nocardioidaceae bacterium]
MTAATTPIPSAPARSRGLGAWLRTLDPMLPLTCAVALGVYLLHGFGGALSRDIALYSYAGQQVADGVPPYVAVLNRAGPLAHLVPGIGAFAAQLVGADELLGMRVLSLVIAVACIGVAYLLGRDVLRSRVAGLASAAALLCFQGVATYATYGPREKTPLLLFLLVALLASAHRRWVTAGVMIALATLTWQPSFFAAIVCTLVVIAVDRESGGVRSALKVVVGGLLPPTLFLVAYAATGHLRVLLDDFVLINWRYTEQVSYLDDLSTLYAVLDDGFGWTKWVFVVGMAAVPFAAYRALRSPLTRRDLSSAVLAGATAALMIGWWWSTKAFNGWADVFFLLPEACLGFACLVAAVARRFSPRTAVAAGVAWGLASTALTVWYVVDTRDHRLDQQRAETAGVLGALPAHDRQILSVSAPQPLVLAHQRNPNRVQLFSNGVIAYLDDTWPGGHEGFADTIDQDRPAVVSYGRIGVRAFAKPAIDAAYTCVGSSPGWYWYLRNDLGTERLQQARAALSDHACPATG